jgi:hypothetical protein
MPACVKCGLENAAGSKFCAACGTAIPTNPRCAGCGAENPAGSKFCKKCGAPLQGAAQPGRQTGPPGGGVPPGGGQGPGPARRPAALSDDLNKVKMLLWVAVGLFAVGIYLNYSSMSQLRALYGQFADTTQSWFMILLDVGVGGLSAYAAFELAKGSVKLAKAATIANAVVGGIALLLFFKSGIISIALNGGLAACGIWARLLISKEERPLV